MAEFDKNTKGIAFIFFCRKLSFFDIVIFWCIIKYMAHKDQRNEMQTVSMSQNSYINLVSMAI